MLRLCVCFLLAAALVGCDLPPVVDDAMVPTPDATRPVCELRFAPAEPLRLRTRDRVTLQVRVTPVTMNTEVQWVLVGDAIDSSLSVTRRTVDAMGVVSSELTASSSASAFRVRAAAACAADVYLDVSVADRGAGSLAVEALYRGSRTPTRIAVGLYRAANCAALGTIMPDRSAVVPLPGGMVSFNELPAGVGYVVRGLALGRSDVELAAGCLGPVQVNAGAVARASLAFVDAPLLFGNRYELAMSFDLSAVGAMSATRWLAPVTRELSRTGGDASLVGSEIAAAVAMAAMPTERDRDRTAFELAYRERLAAMVTAQLVRREATSAALFERIASAAENIASAARSIADVTSVPEDRERFLITEGRFVLDPETPDVTGDDVEVPAPTEARARITPGPRDTFIVDLDGYSLPWNVLTRAALGAWLRRQGVSTSSEHVALSVCPVVVPIVRGATGRCDDDCVTMACRRAITSLGSLFDGAVTSLEPSRTLLDLRWSATPSAAAGSLTVDRLTGIANGTFREDTVTRVGTAAQLTRVTMP
jgi:hypothetical protein